MGQLLSNPVTSSNPAPVHHPGELVAQLRRRWGPRQPLWVFGYASLIWRPEFAAAEQHPALVHGWHRALRMRSRVNRGTPEQPGLVFALLPGGACRGEVYRLPAARAEAELERLWQREMPTGVYTPRWLPCRTPQGTLPALAFTLQRHSDAHLGRLPDAEVLHILRHARGRYGSTLDYLVLTAQALRQRGIVDREIQRLMALARHAGLLGP
jgi:glutathione-specific gamma-glutamylcyclotransferase